MESVGTLEHGTGKHPGGRHSLYANTPEGLEKFRREINKKVLPEEAANLTLIADRLETTRQTIYNYMKRGEAWQQAIRRISPH